MKNYSIREKIPDDVRGNFLEHSDIVAHLLFHRGITDSKEASLFLSPDFEKGTHSPFLLSDMEKAVGRILSAIEKKEKIVVFADYDADGIPGGAIFSDFFKKISYENFHIYIPDRSLEGFGLSRDAIERFVKDGANLLITVDCGITNTSEVDYANSLSLDVIITDHHLPKETLPNAFAIVNPKVSPDYPEKMLCGAAVAWKVVSALIARGKFDIKEGWEKWLLDLVGIATLSDMVPLQGENRVLAHFGLVVLRKGRRLGLSRLTTALRINQRDMTSDDIGFMISPRINAASRMGAAYDALSILTTDSHSEADALVKKLEKANRERKGSAAYLVKEVKKKIEAKYSPYFSNKIIVAGDPSWKPSLLGVVANNLSEHHGKPVFLWGREEIADVIKGSCRSSGGVSVTSLMEKVSPGVFTEFGGHHAAGGFSVSYDSIHALEEKLEEAFHHAATEAKEEVSWIDHEISFSEVNENLLREIERLEPYGMENPKPLFLIRNAEVLESSLFGKEKNHLKVVCKGEKGNVIEAITFFADEPFIQKAQEKKTRDIVGHIERNFFGKGRVRIRLVDLV